jgi:hypothetical protein
MAQVMAQAVVLAQALVLEVGFHQLVPVLGQGHRLQHRLSCP